MQVLESEKGTVLRRLTLRLCCKVGSMYAEALTMGKGTVLRTLTSALAGVARWMLCTLQILRVR